MRFSFMLALAITGWTTFAANGETQPVEESIEEEPTVPLTFSGYPDAPSFTVAPLNKKIKSCARCHATMETDTTIRLLEDAPHVDAMTHGNGRIWCLICHDEQDRDQLRTFAGEKVSFQNSHLVCGSCHPQRQKDWYFGAHGKREANWDGDRVLVGCTNCHDPHEPIIQPREPKAPPPVRAGLPKMNEHERAFNIWPWITRTEVGHE
jgi:hypothetical protein